MTLTLDLPRARAHWFTVQGLHRPVPSRLDALVSGGGWLRTIGGVDVYLAMRTRAADLTREQVDAAVADGALRVSPAVRGCIYLVPDTERALALRTADLLSRRRMARDLEKVGVEAAEIEALGTAVLEALDGRPATTAALRKALPDGAIRRLGDAGKKVGMSSTLPVTLRTLEFAGRIERMPVNHRLDHEQYVWRRPADPLDLSGLPDDPAAIAPLLVERFFAFAGPATLDEFVKWSGLTKGQARKGIAAAGLVPVRIEGYGDALALPATADTLAAPAPDIEPRMQLLNFADNYLAVRSRPAAFVDPAHADRRANSWGRGSKPLVDAQYLHCRAVVRGDELIGSWEWDPDREAIVAVAFGALGSADEKALRMEADAVSAFLRAELGHARSTSIDSPKAQRQRLAVVQSGGR